MTPTIEEVKRVAKECKIYPRHNDPEEYWCYQSALQAFAQHWIEVGRKEQREKDENIAMNWPNDDAFEIAEAIRNNTGE